MEWFGEAINLLSADLGGWITAMLPCIVISILVTVALSLLALCTAGLSVVGIILIGGSISASSGAMLLKLRTGIAPDFNAIMRESSVQWFPGAVLFTIGFIAYSIGLCFFVVPGFFVLSAWALAHVDMGAGETDPVRAFSRAWGYCLVDPIGWLLFGLVYSLTLGFVVTVPLSLLVPVVAYRDTYRDA